VYRLALSLLKAMANEFLESLLRRESSPEYKIHGTAREWHSSHADPEEGQSKWAGFRVLIANWYMNITDHFDVPRLVAVAALNYLDRYMIKYKADEVDTTLMDNLDFQLLGVSACLLAFKSHGPSNKMMTVGTMVELSRKLFSAADIEQMELKLLQQLNANLNPPLPAYFLKSFLGNITKDLRAETFLPSQLDELHQLAGYLTELSACTSEPFISCHFPASVIAFACILEAIDIAEQGQFTSLHPSQDVAPLCHFLRPKVMEEKRFIIPSVEMDVVESAQGMIHDALAHRGFKEDNGKTSEQEATTTENQNDTSKLKHDEEDLGEIMKEENADSNDEVICDFPQADDLDHFKHQTDIESGVPCLVPCGVPCASSKDTIFGWRNAKVARSLAVEANPKFFCMWACACLLLLIIVPCLALWMASFSPLQRLQMPQPSVV
jgi:hypothetical protein